MIADRDKIINSTDTRKFDVQYTIEMHMKM